MTRAAKAPSTRLLSLDVFRGLTIAGMILVNSPGNDSAYAPLDHAEWNGLTPTDLVFPFFVFIVGVSAIYSLQKRIEAGDAVKSLLALVLKRSLIIFTFGLLLNGFPAYDLAMIRIPGVLQRIAVCYFFSSLFILYSNTAVMVTAIGLLLGGYAWLMTHVPVPGFALGDLSKEGNVAAFFDRIILSADHMYRHGVYDPEGVLSTLPAIATGLFGNLTGQWLRSAWTQAQKVTGMLQAGLILLLAGMKWTAWMPLNKALWTPSYVLVTAGIALLVLCALYWAIEFHGWRSWSKPLEVFGVNAIAAYILHVFFLKLQNLWKVPLPDGTLTNSRIFFTQHVFEPWLSPVNASLAYALLYTFFWLLVCGILYRRKLFLKI